MRKQYAKVRGKTFQVWSGATKDQITKMLNESRKGLIVVCPVCKHVDIDPYKHFSSCNPENEAIRQQNQYE